jgi:hypothetical protein
MGYYSSTDNATIDQQLTLAAKAHMEAFISSWWGPGHHTDTALQHIIGRSERADSPYQNMRWAIYHEQEGQRDPSVSELVSDLNYLNSKFFGHPGYLRINGKPVVFVWANGSDGSGMASRWAQAKAAYGGNVFIVLKVYSGFRTDPNQPDSWHQYGPATNYSEHLPYSATVSPGFWLKGEASPRLGRDASRFDLDVQRMAATGAFWQLVTTWSEWGEGTIVEPAAQWGNTYIDILCRRLPGAVSCGAGSVTPTPAPTPAPPAPPPGGTSAVLVGAGDIVPNCLAGANMANAEATAALIDNIPGTVFTAGDNAYEEGSSAQYNQCYHPTWGRHKARTKPVPGNHEYLTSGASGYYSYFGAAAGDPTKGYYAWDPMPGWRAYMLNSGSVNKGAELTWLQGDLAANPRQCVVAFFHHPVYTAGPHADDEGGMRDIWRALYDAGADLAVNGHDHSYQRFAPLNRDGNGPQSGGMREIVVGVGGKNITTQTRVPAGLEAAMDGDTNPAMGVLKLTLQSGSYGWQFIPVPGKTFTDSGSQSCR